MEPRPVEFNIEHSWMEAGFSYAVRGIALPHFTHSV
jgi:hypothetical protein